MDNEVKNDVVAMRETMEDLYTPRAIEATNTNGFIVYPENMNVVPLKKYIDEERTTPETLKGLTFLHDCTSFCEFVNRYKADNSAIFYNKDAQMVTCIFDCATKEHASFEKHLATYKFPFSKELQEWKKHNGETMSQVDFAFFIERNVLDLSDAPTPDKESDSLKEIRARVGGFYASTQKMVELSRGIAIRNDERATVKFDTNTGEATLDFSSEHQDAAGNKIKVPNMFLIVIPILNGGKAYQLPCRLRYRLYNGTVKWWYEVINLDQAIDKAIDEDLEAIKKETALPIFAGELPQGR